MPLSAIDWPETLMPLVHQITVIPASNGKGCCRWDVDVDAETLTLLNHFEAHARHRQVRIWMREGKGWFAVR